MALLSCAILSGCAANGLVTPKAQLNNVDFKFTGIPIALAMQGSAVRLDENWVLTAKHNAPSVLFDNLITHPICDIGVYKDKGEMEAPLSAIVAYENQEITTKGYAGWFAMPAEGKGKFVQYVNVTATDDPNSAMCKMALVDAPLWSGMSGGGAFTSEGNLLGINAATYQSLNAHPGNVIPIKEQERYSAIVPVCSKQVSDWLQEVTGKNFCEELIPQ